MPGKIRIGVGGWTFDPWKGAFYPEGLPARRELEYMASVMSAVEVNGTYYRTQTPDTFSKWHDETPDDFVFALKAPRYATNRRVLAEAGESIRRFLDSGITRLRAKLGPINWQFLPTKTFDPVDFAAFLDLLPAEEDGRPLRHAVELRHPSFAVPEVLELCRARGVAIVCAGDSDYPQIADATAPLVYARIMGTRADHPLGYREADLDRWADRARAWAAGKGRDGLPRLEKPDRKARDVFLFVISGAKERNPLAARALIQRIEGA